MIKVGSKMNDILKESKKLNEELIQIRRELHQIPELDMDLPKSKAFIKNKLVSYGYEPIELDKSGLYAEIGQGEKRIMLRADFDALPILEQTDLKFKSTNGCMHACGHDIHATMLLGTAKLLKKYENELNCKVRLLFQPGEETGIGAQKMIEEGALEGVDESFMIHVVTGKGMPTGKIVTTCTGASTASSTKFDIKIKGKGGHGSTPFMTKDPINAASHMVLNLQTITSREMNVFDPAIISVCKIQGGNNYNIIPDSVALEGTLRTFGNQNVEHFSTRIKQVVEKTADVFDVQAEIDIFELIPSVIQNKDLYLKTIDQLTNLFGKENIMELKDIIGSNKIPGSEDFSFYSQLVPSTCLFLGLATEDEYGLHHPKVSFDEEHIYMGVASFVTIALNANSN